MHANHDSPLAWEGLLKFQSPNRLSSSGRIVIVSPIHPKCPAAILVAVDKIAERCKQATARPSHPPLILRERSLVASFRKGPRSGRMYAGRGSTNRTAHRRGAMYQAAKRGCINAALDPGFH